MGLRSESSDVITLEMTVHWIGSEGGAEVIIKSQNIMLVARRELIKGKLLKK